MTTIVTISDDFVVINSIVFATTLISSLKKKFCFNFLLMIVSDNIFYYI